MSQRLTCATGLGRTIAAADYITRLTEMAEEAVRLRKEVEELRQLVPQLGYGRPMPNVVKPAALVPLLTRPSPFPFRLADHRRAPQASTKRSTRASATAGSPRKADGSGASANGANGGAGAAGRRSADGSAVSAPEPKVLGYFD